MTIVTLDAMSTIVLTVSAAHEQAAPFLCEALARGSSWKTARRTTSLRS
jgi:hypothetical protein